MLANDDPADKMTPIFIWSMPMSHYAQIGSISEGTLRTNDLLDTFSYELRSLMRGTRLTRATRKAMNETLREIKRYDDGAELDYDPSELVSELENHLQEFAPPYAYFGTLDGDGACFGFWPIVDDDELPRLDDMSELENYRGDDVYIVNDHGNVTCGRLARNGRFVEYWSCV